jgi:hypothetical protein
MVILGVAGQPMQQRDFTTRLGGAAAGRRAARALQRRIWRVRVLAGVTADDQVARARKNCAWGARGPAYLVSLMLLSIAAAINANGEEC